MCGDKVLQNIQSFTEVGLNRKFDSLTGCIRHESTHTGKLLNLLIGTTGSGVRHHEDVVIFIQTGKKVMRQLIVRVLPGLNHFLVSLFFRNQTSTEVLCNSVYGFLCIFQKFFLACRNGHIVNGNRHGSLRGILVADCLDIIECQGSLHSAVHIHHLFQNLLQVLLLYKEVDFRKQTVLRDAPVNKAEILRNNFVEKKSSDRRINDAFQHLLLSVFALPLFLHFAANLRVQGHKVILISQDGFIDRLEKHSLSKIAVPLLGEIVYTEYHIL